MHFSSLFALATFTSLLSTSLAVPAKPLVPTCAKGVGRCYRALLAQQDDALDWCDTFTATSVHTSYLPAASGCFGFAPRKPRQLDRRLSSACSCLSIQATATPTATTGTSASSASATSTGTPDNANEGGDGTNPPTNSDNNGPTATLLPAIPKETDTSDFDNLKPQDSNMLYYAEQSGTQNPYLKTQFVKLNAAFKYPTVVLEYSEYVDSVTCDGDGIDVQFNNHQAFQTAKDSWSNLNRLVIVTFTDGCGNKSPDNVRTLWLAKKITFETDGVSEWAEVTAQEILTQQGLTDGNLVWGTYTPPGQEPADLPNPVVDDTDIKSITCAAPPSNPFDGFPSASCGANFDQDLDDQIGYYPVDDQAAFFKSFAPGFKTPPTTKVRSRSDLEDRSFCGWCDDAIDYVADAAEEVVDTIVEGVGDIVDTITYAAGAAYDAIKGLLSYDGNFGIITFPLDYMLGDEETPFDGKKGKKLYQLTNGQEEKLNGGEESGGGEKKKREASTTQTKRFSDVLREKRAMSRAKRSDARALEQLRKRKAKYTAPLDNLSAKRSPASSTAIGPIQAREEGGSDEGGDSAFTYDLGIYCVECGMAGFVTIYGSAKFSVLEGKLQGLGLGFQGSMQAGINLGLDGSVKWAPEPYEKTILNFPIPDVSLSLPGILEAGAFIELGVELDYSIELKGQMLAGAALTIGPFDAHMDLIDRSDEKNYAKGFEASVTKTFDASASLTLEAGAYMPLAFLIKVEIPLINWEEAFKLEDKPGFELEVVASASYSAGDSADDGAGEGEEGSGEGEEGGEGEDGEGDDEEDTCPNGLKWEVKAVNDIEASIPFLDPFSLSHWEYPIAGDCYQLAGAETHPDPVDPVDPDAPDPDTPVTPTPDPTTPTVALKDTTSTYQLTVADSGSLFMTTDSAASAFKGTKVLLSDSSSRLLHYHPDLMSKYGVSRVRFSDVTQTPLGSKMLTLAPATIKGQKYYVAVDTQGRRFFPITCRVTNGDDTSYKVFVAKNALSGPAKMKSANLQWTVAGGVVEECAYLPWIPTA